MLFGEALSRATPICSGMTFTYSVVLSFFRHSVWEHKSVQASLKEILKYFMVCYATYRFMAIQDRCGQYKSIIHLVIIALNARMVSSTYNNWVAGTEPKQHKLNGKVYIITGCNTGIGYETARQLLVMGGKVVMACRSLDKAKQARMSLIHSTGAPADHVKVLKLDLCDFNSVRSFVKAFEALELPLHCLINNAGVMMQERQETKDGLEMVMTANHLSHFLLTNLLIGHLDKQGNGRIVVLTSALHRTASHFDFDDFMSTKNYSLFETYAQSKLANVMHVKMLAALLKVQGSRVTVNAVHPGCVRTEVTRNMPYLMRLGNWLAAPIMMTLQKTPVQGAWCTVHVATSAETSTMTGQYFFHNTVQKVNPCVNDEAELMKLWKISESYTKSAVLSKEEEAALESKKGK